MTPARILIISNGALCRNPRALKEATALGRAGHAVTVLTVRNHAASEARDLEILRDAPFQRVVVDQLDRGVAAFRTRLSARIARHAVSLFGWPTPRALGPVGALFQAAVRLPADLTIVHNEAPHYVGVRLLAEGRRVAADIEDWHSEDLLPGDRRSRPLRLLREVERTLLNAFAYTTTTSHALADALHQRYGGVRPHVIANAFPLQAAPNRKPNAGPPAFFWFSQTLGAGRGVELFLAAWQHMRQPSRLVLLGESRDGYAEKILGHLPAPLHSRIAFSPLVSPAALPAVIAEHDIGLALEQAFIVNRDLTITNKIIQYLNAGLAVVASATAGQREVLAHDPSAGFVVETHETTAFARALDELAGNPAALVARQHAARRLAETVYCWEREEPKLLALVADALRAPAPVR